MMAEDVGDAKLEALCNELEENLKWSRHSPVGPNFRTLCKHLADLKDNETERIFHLTESHGVSLRTRALHRISCCEMDPDNLETLLVRKHLAFNGDFSSIQGMKDRLAELPSEWTIVQLTGSYQCFDVFRKPYDRQPMPDIWVTRLPTGDEATFSEPYTQRVSYNVTREEHMLSPFEELLETILENKTKPKKLMNNPRLYWETRLAISRRMTSVVNEVEYACLRGWRFLLLGRLMDTKLEEEIRDYVDKLIKKYKWSSISDRTKYMLYRLAEASQECEPGEIETVMGELEDISTMSSKFAKDISERFPMLASAERKPVILILDELLDSFPWENMEILKCHPVTRVECLPMLYALYKVHENTMKNGYKILRSIDTGFFVMNPDQNLAAMEDRMKIFLSKRIPTWDGIYGTTENKKKSVEEGLTNYDIFFYSGHGNGKHLFGSIGLEKTKIKAVSFLMGCSSNNNRSPGGLQEWTGIAQSYHIGTCPCILGNLWEVSDMDTDRMTAALFHTWLPLGKGNAENIQEYLPDPTLKIPWRHRHQPDLLRALVLARRRPQHAMTSYSFVARGLPVKIDVS